ncbi:MAG: glutamyl-tRNA reductase [Solirubrobacterales bacterium]|nr:glutamyl-tRNA reductase [Solirubrobacterales bacterium]
MSELLSIGVSHKTAPVEVRERLALTGESGIEFVSAVRGAPEVHEVVSISTCNRTELYLVVGDPLEAESVVLGMLARQGGIRATELSGSIYAQRNCEAARHLYRVTSGLDSMIVGEAEIQGQVKRAYEAALAQETTGPLTNHLFEAALATGKRVRTETGISSGQLSLASAGVMLARESLNGLAGKDVVIVGSGEMAETSARAMSDDNVSLTFVAGRRASRALALADRFGGHSVGIEQLPEVLATADVVVCATSSPHLLIEAGPLAEVMSHRDGSPLLLVDLAVPRDIDPECGRLDGVSLHDIDDLEAVVRRNRRGRQGEAARAEGLIEEEIQHFASWLGSLEVRPTVAALRMHAEEIARGVLAENEGRWESASEADLERVDAALHAVVNRLLHRPTLRMKELLDDRVHARMALVRDMFGLEVNDDRAIDSAPVDVEAIAEIRQLPEAANAPQNSRD